MAVNYKGKQNPVTDDATLRKLIISLSNFHLEQSTQQFTVYTLPQLSSSNIPQHLRTERAIS